MFGRRALAVGTIAFGAVGIFGAPCAAWAQPGGTPSEPAVTKRIVVPKGLDAAYDVYGYAPVVRVGDRVVVSGIPAGGPGDDEAKIRRMYEHARAQLASAGASMDDVVELFSFHLVADTKSFHAQFAVLSKVHAEFFPQIKPAWSAIGTTALLDPSAILEMRFEAVVGSGANVRVERASAAGAANAASGADER